jgi:hypothetical protein
VTDPRPVDPATETTFAWHPQYTGRTPDAVRRELAEEIARDQRAYELALEGAEHSEHDSLSSVMEIEKRWGSYSFDWAELDPQVLADRIVDFELAREQRRAMFPYAEYRERSEGPSAQARGGAGRASMTDEERRRIANIGAVVVMVVLAIIVVAVVIAIL